MNNQQIAKIFNEIADLLELKGENMFRIRAYRRAAQSIDGMPNDIATLTPEELTALPGIGNDLAGKIREYLNTGTIKKYLELKKEVPGGVLELLKVRGLGPKKAKQFYDTLNIKNVDDLATAVQSGKLKGLPGIQKKTEENIMQSISWMKKGAERRPLGRLLPLAENIILQIKEAAPVGRIEVAGSIRRRKETVGDIDILATSKKPETVMNIFINLPHVTKIVNHGETKSSVITDDGVQVDLRVVDENSFGAALQYFTGSKQHNIRLREIAVHMGLKLNEYGVFQEPGNKRTGGKTEEGIYKALKLPYIPPELREDAGEIEAARENKLPELVTIEDIKGDLHVHTKWSDGSYEIHEMVAAARTRGYQYVAITDHTKGLGVAHGLDESRLAREIKLIDEINKTLKGFKILKGIEVDIKSDGKLDLPDETLAELDIVVASIHSGFKQSREQLTDRLLSAIRNPLVNVIAHPTGRLIGERDAYAVDMEAVFKESAKYDVAMEINAYPLRLDLNDFYIKMAKRFGVSFVICTDAHIASQYDYMSYGVAMARRGWLEKKNVLNTLPLEQLIKKLKSCRAGKIKMKQQLIS
ncbi:MAG: hypothetical protein APR62_09310 [Smithella sp. SDB]|nr:MAG: hypothetical protein APR62_09310 [Smithella sp. SDB]